MGELSPDVKEEDLMGIFGEIGKLLNVRIVRDPITFKSKRYGFVNFTNKKDRDQALLERQGTILLGHPMVLREGQHIETKVPVEAAENPFSFVVFYFFFVFVCIVVVLKE